MNFTSIVSMSLVLLSILTMEPNYADEIDSCTKSCLDVRMECNKQANLASDQESHPMLSDSSASRDTGTQLRSLRFPDNATSGSQSDEVQRRRVERKQVCELENSRCQNSCSPKPASPKNSVIYK